MTPEPGAPEDEEDDGLIVCVSTDTGRGYLPVTCFDPLVKQIEDLIAQCAALQERLDQVARIVGTRNTVTP